MSWCLDHGDCREVLRQAEPNSVDAIVTDPPGGIGFMGRAWDSDKGGRDQWIEWMAEIMSQCLRVLKPGGHALIWALPRTSHWTATAVEDAGFEVRDVITHHFASGFPKSLDVGKAIDKQLGVAREVVGYDASRARPNGVTLMAPVSAEARQWDGWATALKPAVEMWLKCRKPFTTVPLDGIMAETTHLLRGLLCRMSFVKCVEASFTLNPSAYVEEMCDSARWIAEALSTVEKLDPCALMDTFRSLEVARTFWSIGWLWNSILGDLCGSPSMFTTSMEPRLTTELKTLNALILQTTPESITPPRTPETGPPSDAITAASALSALEKRLSGIRVIIVPEGVTGIADSSYGLVRYSSRPGSETDLAGSSEHWILARKPLGEKNVAMNVLKHGTGGLNIDACRVERASDDVPGWHKSGSYGREGGYLGSDTFKIRDMPPEEVQARCGDKGRWPTNLVLTHAPGCEGGGMGACVEDCPVAEVDQQSGNKRGSTLKKDYADQDAGGKHGIYHDRGNRTVFGYGDAGGASRFFPTFRYVPKPSRREREAGLEKEPLRTLNRVNPGGLENDPRWGPVQVKNIHPTVKAKKLMDWLITLITPPKGLVLDPFAGSGSTGVAAVAGGFSFWGIEQDAEYVRIAEARIAFAMAERCGQLSLFDEEE